MERIGLVGAMPLGGRWRAQGYIDGSTKYLGTFDTEEEAHQVFLREKARVEAEREAEAAREVERILAGPTYVYEGGKGRGANFNGTLFKVIEAHGPHQVLAVPLDDAGMPDFTARTKVTLAYLKELPAPKPGLDPALIGQLAKEAADWDSGKLTPKDWEPAPEAVPLARPVVATQVDASRSAAITVDPSATKGLQEAVRRFATRSRGQDVTWALDFLKEHGRADASAFADAVTGTKDISDQLAWLRKNTTLPLTLIDGVERGLVGGLFVNDEVAAAARVLHREFPESFDEPDMRYVDAEVDIASFK